MKNKVLEIKEFLDINKTRKKKIVLCHGVFDLLHIGHIYYFEESKSLGDLLIVSITSDRFVNKGNYRLEAEKTLKKLQLRFFHCRGL